MSQHDIAFHRLLDQVMSEGEYTEGRNGGTRSIFGAMVKYDLRLGFPLLTTKHVPWRLAFAEMLWFISGRSSVDGLVQIDHEGRTVDARKLWMPWAKCYENGLCDVGPAYGVQWRSWNGTPDRNRWYEPTDLDQLADAIATLRDPSKRNSRRIIVSAWQPAEIGAMALPPCHVMYQFSVRAGNRLDMLLFQRSCDLPIGGPFNVAQYAMLQTLVARLAGLTPGVLTHSIADAHVYENQITSVAQWRKQAADSYRSIGRAWTDYGSEPNREMGEPAPQLIVSERSQQSIDDFTLADLQISGYSHLGKVEIPVSV